MTPDEPVELDYSSDELAGMPSSDQPWTPSASLADGNPTLSVEFPDDEDLPVNTVTFETENVEEIIVRVYSSENPDEVTFFSLLRLEEQ